jgi:UDP-2,3-diacylglucosamine pyrophosphatase LpxH
MKVTRRLFVISDLHLGGDYPDSSDATGRGFRICTHVRELTDFVRSITAFSNQDSVDTELVINGDLVDFLAEKTISRNPVTGEKEQGWQPFIADPIEAARVLRQIIDRDRELFVALKDLLAAGNRLTIMLGNHDIELSFPALRRMLIDELHADGKRFLFIYDGEAYQVGDVLIEHGNRYDEWNVVTHDALRRMRSVQSRMEPALNALRGFEAPAGSYLVAGVMNEIKERYPFIDLLKPESTAAIPIVLALAPEYRTRIATIATLVARSRSHVVGRDGLPSQAGDISYDINSPGADSTGEAIIANILRDSLGSEKARDLELATAMTPFDERQGIAGDIQDADLRSLWSTLKLLIVRASAPVADRLPILLSALEGVRGDFSFDRKRETNQYQSAAQRLLSRGFRVVLFGHTHLAKEVYLDGGCYINTGTWADILPFPATILDIDGGSKLSDANKVKAARLARLGEFIEDMVTVRLREHLRFAPTYARIEFDHRNEVISTKLCEYVGPGSSA